MRTEINQKCYVIDNDVYEFFFSCYPINLIDCAYLQQYLTITRKLSRCVYNAISNIDPIKSSKTV